jgi:hypothetical protein
MTTRLGTLCLILMISGCYTYSVKADPRLYNDRTYVKLDKQIKRDYAHWSGEGKPQIGADREGFTVVEGTGAVQIPGGIKYNGKTKNYSWKEINEVKVRADFSAVLACCIIDPTTFSALELKLINGKTIILEESSDLVLFPFWPFYPELTRKDKLGKQLQAIIEFSKQDAAKMVTK